MTASVHATLNTGEQVHIVNGVWHADRARTRDWLNAKQRWYEEFDRQENHPDPDYASAVWMIERTGGHVTTEFRKPPLGSTYTKQY